MTDWGKRWEMVKIRACNSAKNTINYVISLPVLLKKSHRQNIIITNLQTVKCFFPLEFPNVFRSVCKIFIKCRLFACLVAFGPGATSCRQVWVGGQAVSSSCPHRGLWSHFCAAQMLGGIATLPYPGNMQECAALQATVMLLGLSSITANVANGFKKWKNSQME